MDSMNSTFGGHVWIASLLVIFATWGLASLTRSLLIRAGKDARWAFLSLLAPSLSNLIYIFGLQVLIDVVPFNPKLLAWLDGGAYLLAVLIILGLARKAALVAIEWGASRSLTSHVLRQGFIPLMRNVITLFVFLSGGIMVLKHFNYDVMSLVTALGVSSLAVGLAAKDTLSNMISGFTLIIDRNLVPGDRINLAGTIGEVDEIGLRSTRIKTGEGNMLIVPNAELVNTKILNLSSPFPQTSCSTSIRVPCHIPFATIREHCFQVMKEIDQIQFNPGGWVHLSSLNEGNQLVTIGFWIRRVEDQGPVLSEFHQKLLAHLSYEGIPLLGPSNFSISNK